MMTELLKTIYNVEFNTPAAEKYQNLNFYEIPPSLKLKNIPNPLSIVKTAQEQNKIYMIYNNINKIRRLAQSEQNLPSGRFFCLLWTKKNGEKYGLLFEKFDENDIKAIGIWNLIRNKDLGSLENKIIDDIKHIQDAARFTDVSIFL